MAGRIRAADVDEVKARTNIADVISEHVSLKNAGVGSMKGLCPFHDERSPSFHVKTTTGFYHCFGCGESGDVYSFVQKMDHVTFTEAVERLAARVGFSLTYEESSGKNPETGQRTRILAANAEAAEFFVARLADPDAETARNFLGERGFDRKAAERFGIGYAPKSWNDLRNHLTNKGFTEQELAIAGLVTVGDKGAYDRFRGRVIWPIRDVTGQTIGFGARKLFDDDQGPKYLNTPDTPAYHKAQVLYGLDLAKREIAKTRQVVIVEGYTDVMAAHLSGITTAVATCGTAFGTEHIKLIRRIMGDDSGLGEVVFTFDPDAAGQKAALKAFSEQSRFNAQTFVAVAPDGLDPCDLRLHKGEQAVRDLLVHKVPMFEFVIKTLIANYNLDTVEGRVAALREAAPILAEIRDQALRPGYTRELARLTGVELSEATSAVDRALRNRRTSSEVSQEPSQVRTAESPAAQERHAVAPFSDERSPSSANHIPHDEGAPDEQSESPTPTYATFAQLGSPPGVRLERDACAAVLQYPGSLTPVQMSQFTVVAFSHPDLSLIASSLATVPSSENTAAWLQVVLASVDQGLQPLVTQLAVAPLPESDPSRIDTYVQGIVASVIDRDLTRQKNEMLSRLQRLGVGNPDDSRALQESLLALEVLRRSFRVD